MRRVVVTGMGTVNPLGTDVSSTWEAILDGTSGIGKIQSFDPSELPVKIAGEVKDFSTEGLFSLSKKAKRLGKFVHYAAAAMKEAVRSSGVEWTENPYKTGICIGSGIGGIDSQISNISGFGEKGLRGISPFYIPSAIGNIASGFLSMEYGIKGPNFSVQSACATGNHALASALMLIRSGQADVMFAGGTESCIDPVTIGGFCRMQAMTTSHADSPERASRPFDKDRDGFVLSEGSAVLVLEEWEHARKRGAEILCEVLSVGMTGDAYDLAAPDPEGQGVYYAMKAACEQGGIQPEDLGYINAHATSTPSGDLAEAKAIRQLLGSGQETLYVGSTKSFHGHLLGATAALEAVISILALKKGIVPGNRNLDNTDPVIPLNCINLEIKEQDMSYVLSNSFGFGGHNSSALFGKI